MMIAAVASVLLQAGGAPVSHPAPLDTLMAVSGYQMHLVVYRGPRAITIVMESGGGASLEAWSGVEAELANRTKATVVAYDRAGFGRSSVGPADLTPRQQITQLIEVLERLETPPARILVGHSYGGLLTMLHAHLSPANVQGVVLIDPMNPRFVQATGDFVNSTVPHIEHPASAKDSAVARMVTTFAALVRDQDAGDAGLRTPMVIVTAGKAWWDRGDIDRAWRASHEAMSRAAPHRRLVVAEGADHDIPKQRPNTIVDAVLSLMPR